MGSYCKLYYSDLRAPEGKEDCKQYRDNLVGYRHDALAIDFVSLVAVNPFSKGDATEPENKEGYETEKDPNDCDRSYPPCVRADLSD